jgi:NTE family protein
VGNLALLRKIFQILRNELLIISLAIYLFPIISIAQQKEITITDEDIKPRLVLVLSGGGARGFSQIGFISEMEKAGIAPYAIIGTSIGSIVGGLYSSGYSVRELDSIAVNTNWDEIFSLSSNEERQGYFLDQKLINDRSIVNLRFKGLDFEVPRAISVGSQYSGFLQELIWNSLYQANGDFSNLKFPFIAIATDLVKGQSVLQRKGDLLTAIKASSTIPLRYTPITLDSMVLVDGGLLNNIPVKEAKVFSPQMTIAINSTSELLEKNELDKPWNIADQAVSILINKFNQEDTLNLPENTWIITPEIGKHKNDNFSGIDSLITLGARSFLENKDFFVNKYLNQKASNLKLKLDSLNISKLIYKNREISSDSYLLEIISDKEFQKYGVLNLNIVGNTAYLTSSNNYLQNFSIQLIGAISQEKIVSLEKELFLSIKKYEGYLYSNKTKVNISEAILKLLRKKEYSFASIRSLSYNNGNLKLEVDLGTLNEIIVKGNNETQNYLILREIGLTKNEVIKAKNLIEIYDNLNATGLFSNVSVSLERNTENKINAIINVEERGKNTIRISAKLDNMRYTQANVDIGSENIGPIGGNLGLRIAGGQRNFLAALNISNYRVLTSNFTYEMSMFYKQRDVWLVNRTILSNKRFDTDIEGSETEIKTGLLLSVGSQLERFGKVSLGLRHEFQKIYNVDSTSNFPFIRFTNFFAQTIIDNRNSSYFPTSGSNFGLRFETAIDPQSNTSFTKFNFNFQSSLSTDMVTITPSLIFGFADRTMPRSEFFSIGGQRNFFGNYEDEQRGRQLLVANLELRTKLPFKIFFDTYLSARYDLGRVWENQEVIKFETLLHGVGSELTFDTPIGPAKFGLGRSFYFIKNPNSAVLGQIHGYFSIGVDFGY